MIKKTINYDDVNGKPRTEDFYFNLTKSDIHEWAMVQPDYDLEALLREMTASQDATVILKNFKLLISKSVGLRSEGGRGFMKTPEFAAEFMGSNAYSELFLELVQDGGKMSAFVNGIIPPDVAQRVAAQSEPRDAIHTDAELMAMSDDEFDAYAGTEFRKMTKANQQIAYRRSAARAA